MRNEGICNYRITRDRRALDNSSVSWAINVEFYCPKYSSTPDVVTDIALACVILHTFLAIDLEQQSPILVKNLPSWGMALAKEQQNLLLDYFVNKGTVPWQEGPI